MRRDGYEDVGVKKSGIDTDHKIHKWLVVWNISYFHTLTLFRGGGQSPTTNQSGKEGRTGYARRGLCKYYGNVRLLKGNQGRLQ